MPDPDPTIAAACPPPADLRAYHGGELPPDRADAVGAHVDACPVCEAALQELDAGEASVVAGLRRDQARRPGERAGTVLAGRYVLADPLGEGGMGAVWKAEQAEPVKRTVAVKLIKPGMDSAAVLRRFAAERQALALMDHPNIARVLDAGTTDAGRPFFVMELVPGVPLTDYCDDRRLTPRQRLELFVPVCRAVQHAHQKGVIHRDLKPSNILVAEVDGRPVPKVIDFGVAKATGAAPDGHTAHTGLGAVVGTPEYMAPEQADPGAADVDTRADVYALGVILYELLTGSTPLTRRRVQQAALLEVLRLVREEESPPPSRRLSAADTRPGVAAVRGTEPARLSRLLRGELDWVVLKALEKDRGRRYESAGGFARDLERFLADEPVEAGRPTRAHRLRRFARRHHRLLAAALTLGLLLATAAGVSTWQAVRATRAERAARTERDTARAINDFLLHDLLDQANPDVRAEHDPAVTLRAVLDRAAVRVPDRFAGRPTVEAAVRLTIGAALRSVNAFAAAEAHLQRAYDLRLAELGADHPDTLAALHELGRLHQDAGRHARALEVYRDWLARCERAFGPDHPGTLEATHAVGAGLQLVGRAADALPLHERVLAARRRALGDADPATIRAMEALGSACRMLGRYEESVEWQGRGAELATACPAYGPAHPYTLSLTNGLALSLAQRTDGKADLPRAAALLEAARAESARAHGPRHALTLTLLNSQAYVHRARGHSDRAVALYREALAGRVAAFGPDSPPVQSTRALLARTHLSRQEWAAAEPLLREAVDARLRTPGGSDLPDTPPMLRDLAATLERLGRDGEAEGRYAALVPLLRRRAAGRDDAETAAALSGLGRVRLRAGAAAAAEPTLREAVAAWRAAAPDARGGFAAQSLLGEGLAALGQSDEAERWLLTGHAGLVQRAGAPGETGLLGPAVDRLVQFYTARRNPAEADRWRAERAKLPAEAAPPPRPMGK